MTTEQKERLIISLLAFVERAAKPEATTAEVGALAEAARVLFEYGDYSFFAKE